MSVYKNKLQRSILLLSGNVLGSIFCFVTLFLVMLMAMMSDIENAMLIMLIPNVIIISMILLHQWFSFYRYLLNYSRINSGNIIIIDNEAKTIECRKSSQSTIEAQNISKITLYRHENFKREIDSPKSIKDNVINILADGPGPLKFKNIWYVKVLTENGQKYYLTPLMLKIKELPFKDLNVEFTKRPIIDYGS